MLPVQEERIPRRRKSCPGVTQQRRRSRRQDFGAGRPRRNNTTASNTLLAADVLVGVVVSKGLRGRWDNSFVRAAHLWRRLRCCCCLMYWQCLTGTNAASLTLVGTFAGLGIEFFVQVNNRVAFVKVKVGFLVLIRYRLFFVVSLLFQAVERTQEE